MSFTVNTTAIALTLRIFENDLDKESTPNDNLVGRDSQQRDVIRRGHVIFLDDIAHRTYVRLFTSAFFQRVMRCLTSWNAFIFWAYFGECNFAPLKSQSKSRILEAKPGEAPPCSPKSMYRVAHKVITSMPFHVEGLSIAIV